MAVVEPQDIGAVGHGAFHAEPQLQQVVVVATGGAVRQVDGCNLSGSESQGVVLAGQRPGGAGEHGQVASGHFVVEHRAVALVHGPVGYKMRCVLTLGLGTFAHGHGEGSCVVPYGHLVDFGLKVGADFHDSHH